MSRLGSAIMRQTSLLPLQRQTMRHLHSFGNCMTGMQKGCVNFPAKGFITQSAERVFQCASTYSCSKAPMVAAGSISAAWNLDVASAPISTQTSFLAMCRDHAAVFSPGIQARTEFIRRQTAWRTQLVQAVVAMGIVGAGGDLATRRVVHAEEAQSLNQLATLDEDGDSQAQYRPLFMLRELEAGTGQEARTGTWVTVHYVVRVLGNGVEVENTRASGYGDRAYGEPHRFRLGDLQSPETLRLLHFCVDGMRVGGKRRARTLVADRDFGYRHAPQLYDENYKKYSLEESWLMDVEVSLVGVSTEPPLTWFQSIVASLVQQFNGARGA
mmetsp:Transcript_58140/g.126281  ORF Transcript_58140/g.126281 Transcript_58140/m.126281 type:complete len:327 (+) Transcript_58140:114-1094(+)